MYIPSLADVTYDGPGRVAAITPRPGSGAPPVVQKAAVRGADRLDPPSTSIFTPDTEFGSRLLIEVVRGCANLCRFCWAGYNYLPVRPFSTERILDIAAAARPHATRVGLVSIALCDHPDIELILERLVAMGYGISPASLRLDDLTEPIVRLLRQSGERSITIAPETGSDRLRRVINKTVTNEDILDRADLIFRCGIENLKLYYMLGLPTETDDDLVAIRDLTMAIRERMLEHAARAAASGGSSSVNPLVPKPGTTYQWLPMTDARVIEDKSDRFDDSSPAWTMSTSTSSPNGTRTTRACSRSATAWRTSSGPSGTAPTGAPPWRNQVWTPTPISTATAPRTPFCPGRSSTAR